MNTKDTNKDYKKEYFKCLIICLEAVEQNRPGLLADINPYLLSKSAEEKENEKSTELNTFNTAPNQSPSPLTIDTPLSDTPLPTSDTNITEPSVGVPVERGDMGRRTAADDRLAPPVLRDMNQQSELTLSAEHAIIKPSSYSSSSGDSAREALLNMLSKSGEPLDDDLDFITNRRTSQSHDALDHMLPGRPGLEHLAEISRDQRRKSSREKESSVEKVHECDSALSSDMYGDNQVSVIKSTNNNQTGDNRVVVKEDVPTDWNGESTSPDVYLAGGQDLTGSRDLNSVVSVDSGYSTLKSDPAARSKNVDLRAKSLSRPAVSPNRQSGGKHYRSMSDAGMPSKSDYQVMGAAEAEASSSLPRSADHKGRSSFFHMPAQGEGLIDFLSSQDFNTCADLDKENAHFSISETLIAAFEKMKWNQVITPPSVSDDQIEGDSDEEIQQLKQRIRIRRRHVMTQKAFEFQGMPEADVTVTTTSQNTDSQSDLTDSQESFDFSGEIHDAELNEDTGLTTTTTSNLKSLKESGLSLSLASLYSEQELYKSNLSMERRLSVTDSGHQAASAESVAIALLKRFSEKQLPKASELEWLVSEQDAPQRLLPLPESIPVSPDDNENYDLLLPAARTRLRGNLEWAPPRGHIIFNIHDPPKKKVVLAKQNYRCAGCGTKVDKALINSYHYCTYLGKYFCPCCHSKEQTYIPAYVLQKWDFRSYPVSHFSKKFLAKIYSDPLYSVQHINPALYRRVKELNVIRDYRIQLVHLLAFLRTCKYGKSELESIESSPNHWVSDPHLYSIEELVSLKQGQLLPVFKQLVTAAISHTSRCELCMAKGFICELCNMDRDIIFPFELGRVVQCNSCKTCFHKTCFKQHSCPKCARIELRRQSLQEQPSY